MAAKVAKSENNAKASQKTKGITLVEIDNMESSIDRRMRILDEQIAREKAKRETEAAAAGTPAQQVTDGAELPTAPNNYDAIGTWPFPHGFDNYPSTKTLTEIIRGMRDAYASATAISPYLLGK